MRLQTEHANERAAQEAFVAERDVDISEHSHLNITVNLFRAGNCSVRPDESMPFIDAEAFTMLAVRSGAGFFVSDACKTPVAPGQLLVAFPGQHARLSCIGTDAMNVTYLCFGGYLLDVYLNRASIYVTLPVAPDPTGDLAHTLDEIYMRSQRLPNRYCKMLSLLYAMLARLLDENPAHRAHTAVEGDLNAHYYALRGIDFIERNYSRALTTEQIAQRLGVSRKHLCAVFRQTIGITPKKYTILYRVERAEKLLRDTPKSMAEIAEAVGYSDQFHMSKEFARMVGVTPSEYRRGKRLAPEISTSAMKGELVKTLGGSAEAVDK